MTNSAFLFLLQCESSTLLNIVCKSHKNRYEQTIVTYNEKGKVKYNYKDVLDTWKKGRAMVESMYPGFFLWTHVLVAAGEKSIRIDDIAPDITINNVNVISPTELHYDLEKDFIGQVST